VRRTLARSRLAVLLLAAACDSPARSGTPPSGPPPAAVEIVAVRHEPISDVVDLVGQLDAEESVVLKSETAGIVDSIDFQDGDEVDAGHLLFRLRDGEQRAKLREAEAALTLAEDEFGRAKALAAQKTVSQSELDRATAEAEAARARRDMAQVALDRMSIRAPFDGVLGARLVSPGDRVSKNTGLVRIDAVKRLRLSFSVPEMAVTAMRVGSPVEIAVGPWPGERFHGAVYFVAPTLDPANRRLLLKAWVPNPDRRLRPGLFANIRLEVAHRDAALVVPEAAVAYDAEGPFVWRVGADHTAERVAVELGVRRDGRVEVNGGLAVGDRIVSAGTHKVAPGVPLQEVAPIGAPPPAASGAGGPGAGL
jgi:membrane fusion protein (multidrug efflux system)